jgi:spore germination cell wall hydrolase CwlJ-like protein
MMNEQDLLTLCVWAEARGEPMDGQAAVARVVLNRMKQKFHSDGTIRGTVLAYHQFSWAWFEYHEGKPIVIAKSFTEAVEVSEKLWAKVGRLRAVDPIREIVRQVQAGKYSGTAYDRLTDKAVLYCNRDMVSPAWAKPEKLVCTIGQHSFYKN